jgi:L-fucose isomerase-like protein
MDAIDGPTRKQVFAGLAAEVPSFAKLSPERQSAVAGFYQAVRDFIAQNKLDAICGRCWPDSFEGLDIAFCSVYAMLSNLLPVGCEADQGGTLSLAFLSWLAEGAPAYLADPVALDEKNDTMTYWHCGFGSPKLARPGTDIDVVGHPNRKVPPSFSFALKPGRVTACRLGKGRNGYRLLIGGGEAVDAPLQFSGTSVVVRMDGGSETFVRRLADEGWEYHIALVYGDVREELATLGRLLGVEVWK